MDHFDFILSMLDRSLGSKRKRHIVGGVLVSVSLLFGGLALTVISLKSEDNNNNETDAD